MSQDLPTIHPGQITIEVDVVRRESAPLVERAKSVVITDQATFETGVSLLAALRKAEKDLEKRYRALKDPINVLAKGVDNLFREPRQQLETAIATMNRATSTYQLEQQRIADEKRREEERKRQEEIDRLRREQEAREAEAKKAQEEAARLEAQSRAAVSSSVSLDDMTIDDLTAPAAPDLSLDSLQADLAAHDAAAAAEKARLDLLAAQAKPIEAPVVARTVETGSAKVSFTTAWEFEVTDAKSVPREYLVIDESAIRRAVKAGAREIPGVRIYETRRTTVR